MTEQDVMTGEEHEETLYQTRAKLYIMEREGGWKERGTGLLKLNVRQSDGRAPRLIMRADGVLRLILNVSLYVGMQTKVDQRYLRATVFEEGTRQFITIRTANDKIAAELAEAIHENVPLGNSPAPPSRDPSKGLDD